MQQPTFLRHWGRHWRLLILPLLVVGFTVSLSFVPAGPDPDIDAAQAWFADKYPSPQFMGISVSPNWSSARKVTAPSGALYVEVPLDKTIQSNIGNADGSALSSSETAAVNGTLTLVVELYNGTYSALYFRVTATRNYVNANGKATVLQTKFDQVQSNFSGVLEYFTMESQSTKGIFVENGVPTKVARTQQQLTGQVEDRCVRTDTWTIFYAISGGGSTAPTFTVLNTTHTTMYSPDCFDEPMLPDAYTAGQNNAFWGNNSNVTPPPPPPPPPCKPTQTFGLGTRSGLGYSIAVYGYLWNIDCTVPSFNGEVEVFNTQPLIPLSYTFNQNHVSIIEQAPNPGGNGFVVKLRFYASINFTMGLNNGIQATVTDNVDEIRWALLN